MVQPRTREPEPAEREQRKGGLSQIPVRSEFVKDLLPRLLEAQAAIASINRHALTLDAVLVDKALTKIEHASARHADEVADIRSIVRGIGGNVSPQELSGQIGTKVNILGRVIDIEIGMVKAGIPANADINSIFDSLESAVKKAGTPDQKQAENVLRLAELYITGASAYNSGTTHATKERDSLFLALSSGAVDDKTYRAFEGNLAKLKEDIGVAAAQVLQQMILELKTAQVQREEAERKRLEGIQKDAAALLSRIEGKKEWKLEELAAVLASYRAATAVPDITKEEALYKAAEQLMGNGRIMPNTPEWFGMHALNALSYGRQDVAELAILCGNLQKSAAKDAREYLPSYSAITNAITNHTLTPGQFQQWRTEVTIGTIFATAGKLASDAERMTKGSTRQTIKEVAELVSTRMKSGNLEDALRALDMLQTYVGILKHNGRKTWTGKDQMELAFKSELDGKNATAAFSRGLAMYELGGQMKQVGAWAKKNKAPPTTVLEAQRAVDNAAKAGDLTRARGIIAAAVVFADAAATLLGKQDKVKQLSAAFTNGVKIGKFDSFTEVAGKLRIAYIADEAAQLERIARTSPVGQAVILKAIETARERAKKGDGVGAVRLIGYLWEYYGRDEKGTATYYKEGLPIGEAISISKAVGWRYEILSQSINRDTMARPRDEMLRAIRLEMKATKPADRVAAAKAFATATQRLANINECTTHYHTVLDRVYGNVSWGSRYDAEGRMIPFPLGVYGDGKTDLKWIRIEGEKVGMDKLLSRVEEAAKAGNIQEYNRLVGEYTALFERTALGIISKDAAREMDRQMFALGGKSAEADFLRIRDSYGGTMPKEVAARIESIETRMKSMRTKLSDVMYQGAPLPLQEYGKLVLDINTEGRIAGTYAMISGQLSATEAYYQNVRAATGVDRPFTRETLSWLGASRKSLEQARDAIIAGKFKTAYGNYHSAMLQRQSAMEVYGLNIHGSAITALNMLAFRNMEYGVGDSVKTIAVEAIGLARIAELSVFNVPARSLSNIPWMGDFEKGQKDVFSLIGSAMLSFKLDKHGDAKRDIASAEAKWKEMAKLAERNGFLGEAAYTVTAIGVSFVPGVGWAVGTAMFSTLAFKHAVDEQNLTGHVSPGTWAMLAVSIATPAAIGASTALKASGLAARATDNAIKAERLLVAARGLNYANLAVGGGFAAMSGVEGIRAAGEGNWGRAAYYFAIGAFPLAHITAAKVIDARAAGRFDTELDLPVTGKARLTEPFNIREPTGLFDFLLEYHAADAPGRVRLLETVPVEARAKIASLADMPAVRTALEAGQANEIALAAIKKVAVTIEPPTTRGPGGKPIEPVEVEIASIANNLREFLAGLARPVSESAGATAHAQLETLRAQNPKAAGIIDGLVANQAVMSGIKSGKPDPFTTRTINGAKASLDRLAPDAAAQEAVAVRDATTGRTVDTQVQRQQELEAGMPQRVGTRAQAGEQPPGTVRVRTADGRTIFVPRSQLGAVGDIPSEGPPPLPEAKAAEAPGTGRVGRVADAARGAKDWASKRWASWRSQPVEVKTPVEALQTIRSTIEEIIDLSGNTAERGAKLRDLLVGATDEGDTLMARGKVNSAPTRLANIILKIHEIATDPQVPKAQREQAWVMLSKLCAKENVARMLKDPDTLTSIERDIGKGQVDMLLRINENANKTIDGSARKAGLSPENYRRELVGQQLDDLELSMLLDRTEANIAAQRDNAQRAATQFNQVERPRLEAELTPLRQKLEQAEARRQEIEIRLDAVKALEALPELRDVVRQAYEDYLTGQPRETVVMVTEEAIQSAPISELVEMARRYNAPEEVIRQLETLQTKQGQEVSGKFADPEQIPVERARLEKELKTAQQTEKIAAKALSDKSTELIKKTQDIAGQTAHFSDDAHQPLGQIEQTIGRPMSPSERAALLASLQDKGVLTPNDILNESQNARANVRNGLTTATTDATTATISRSVTTKIGSGQPFETALLETLRSEEVATAVGGANGREAEAAYREAVKGNTLAEVRGKLNGQLEGIGDYVDSVQHDCAGDFELANALKERADRAYAQGQETSGRYGVGMEPIGKRVQAWWTQSWPRAIGAWGVRQAHTIEWGIGAKGREIRAGSAPEEVMTRVKGRALQALQIGIWAGELGLAAWPVYKWLSDNSDVEEGYKQLVAKFPDAKKLIDPSDAKFFATPRGKEIITYIVNHYDRYATETLTPEGAEAAFSKTDSVPDPEKVREIVADLKTMASKLDDLNNARSSGKTKEVDRILKTMGIDYNEAAARVKDRPFGMNDLYELRTADWTSRGIMIPVGRVHARSFLKEFDAYSKPNEMLLTNNPEMAAFLWRGVMRWGKIPAVLIPEVVAELSRNAKNVRDAAAADRPQVMANILNAKGMYLQAEIRDGSYLARVDELGSTKKDKSWAHWAATIFKTYANDPKALENFNAFMIKPTEMVYGEIAAQVAAGTLNSDDARKSGVIGDVAYYDMGVRKPAQVVYLNENKPLADWARTNKPKIKNLEMIVDEVQGNSALKSMRPDELKAYLDKRASIWESKGWWKGMTPAEIAAAKKTTVPTRTSGIIRPGYVAPPVEQEAVRQAEDITATGTAGDVTATTGEPKDTQAQARPAAAEKPSVQVLDADRKAFYEARPILTKLVSKAVEAKRIAPADKLEPYRTIYERLNDEKVRADAAKIGGIIITDKGIELKKGWPAALEFIKGVL